MAAVKFILNNNNFFFDQVLYHQLHGTGMGVDFAASYACLTIGYLEEMFRFPSYLPTYFTIEECQQIQMAFERYMDDGFLIWPKRLDINIFITVLGMLHPQIKYTVERGNQEGVSQNLNMLDVTVILHNSWTIETDIFYKSTNTHYYLPYNSHHPAHIKQNIPYNLAKRIIVFTSDSEREKVRLNELKSWLINSDYPNAIIEKAFHNAKLQGPAPDPKQKKEILPMVTTYYSNYSNQNIVTQSNILLENCCDEEIKDIFKDTKVVLANRQPPNILRRISKALFSSENYDQLEPGLFKFHRKCCIKCKLYVQECQSFITANNYNWVIKSHIHCNSRNVLYYLKCLACQGQTTYTGKTNTLRSRTNNHITRCRLGNSCNKFDIHVFNCRQGKQIKEPYFELYAFMTIKHEEDLGEYELFLHRRG